MELLSAIASEVTTTIAKAIKSGITWVVDTASARGALLTENLSILRPLAPAEHRSVQWWNPFVVVSGRETMPHTDL
ncbi:hypothetical protein BQ8794_220042 [Mesorhizobium prunaredense]|uniref:Uncharacterized protein n=1 Tax=Mesorhizobium prunaredense TaxID=1631249 RepID=A0A1R3V6H3_9HYPH|nr:hypothetical protein BQ8794_220042 [Mesorhizobium prunaredense]